MGMDLLVTQIERQEELGVRNHDGVQVRVHGPEVHERAVVLHRVRDSTVQAQGVERAVEARADSGIVVAEHRVTHFFGFEDDRRSAALELCEKASASLDETRLSELSVELQLRKKLAGGLERRHPCRVEHHARLCLEADAAQSAEEITMLPT